MQSIKAISVFAAFGFVLSLFFGLFSHSPFLVILIKALIFAVLFAGAGFLISFLYQHFLADESSDMQMDGVEPVTLAPANLGQKVDLTVEDRDLPEEENENSYSVNETSHQMLNPSDLKASKPVVQPAFAKAQSTPAAGSLKKANPSDSIPDDTGAPAQEAVNNSGAASSGDQNIPELKDAQSPKLPAAASNAPAESKNEELDTLPDLQSFAIENNSSENNNEQDAGVDSDEGFSTTFAGNSSVSSKKSSSADIQDASIMAKAISTILSNEES